MDSISSTSSLTTHFSQATLSVLLNIDMAILRNAQDDFSSDIPIATLASFKSLFSLDGLCKSRIRTRSHIDLDCRSSASRFLLFMLMLSRTAKIPFLRDLVNMVFLLLRFGDEDDVPCFIVCGSANFALLNIVPVKELLVFRKSAFGFKAFAPPTVDLRR